MANDELAQQLHELKRRNETPIADRDVRRAALTRSRTEKKKRKKSKKIVVTAFERLECNQA
jgi:hypothetical protein